MKTILLKFTGPLQSWGTGSHFETRHTDFYPSKSAVVGIIAASLGYRRDEDEKITRLNELEFVVRVDQQGTLLRDYHIARKFKENGDFDRTYVTNRYYLEDAVFVVAISHKDEAYLRTILEGLQSPYFQTFMGRRSLPLAPDFLLGTTDDSPLESIRHLEWQAASWFMKKEKRLSTVSLEVYMDSHLTENEASVLRKDCVRSFSQRSRTFGFRYESRELVTIHNPAYQPNSDHDIMKVLGG